MFLKKTLLLIPLVIGLLLVLSCSGSKESQTFLEQPANEVEAVKQPPMDEEHQETVEGEEQTNEAEAETEVEATVSFSENIQPILEEACARCHTGVGPGSTHARLETASDISAYAFAIAAVVEAEVMPPWPASNLSVPFANDMSLSEQDRNLIIEWVRQGAPIDADPSTPIHPSKAVQNLDSYDQEILPIGSYDGELGQTDEYRCFIFDPELTEDTYLTEYQFIPDQEEVVHHLVGYRVSAKYRERANELSGSDGQGGWSCFGGTGLGENRIVTLWGPGTGAVRYPDGLGLPMNPGDFFVMQIHYHYDVEAPADKSSFRAVWNSDETIKPVKIHTYFAPAEIPCAAWEEGPLCERDNAFQYALAIYDGQGVQADSILSFCGYAPEDYAHMTNGTASSTCDQYAAFNGTITSVLGHQHQIGTSFRMTLNPDTPDEVILLDIPKWNFEWQYGYFPVEEIQIQQDDVIRLDCTWDRSLRPPNLEPSYVLWADGSDDEMCFAIIMSY